MSSDRLFWNDLYLSEQTAWDIGFVSPPLKNYFDQLEDKSKPILIPGCGNSYEAEYLINSGFTNVTVIDIAEEPVKRLRLRLSEYNSNAIKIIEGDFFNYMFPEKFDLIVEQTFFCAIDRSLRKDYVKTAAELLAPKGKITGVLFKTEFEKPGPPFGGSEKEYKRLFENLFEIKKLEDCYNSHPKRMGNELFFSFVKK